MNGFARHVRPGLRRGLQDKVDAAVQRRIPLWLISLLALGSHGNDRQAIDQAEAHAHAVLEKAAQTTAGNTEITATVGTNETIEEAIEELQWDSGEIVLIGSSRLAASSRIFLGTTAKKMLRSLPVPMIVVPRDYHLSGSSLFVSSPDT